MTDTPDTTEIVAEAIVQTAKEWDGRIDSWTALELTKDAIETYMSALAAAGYVVVPWSKPDGWIVLTSDRDGNWNPDWDGDMHTDEVVALSELAKAQCALGHEGATLGRVYLDVPDVERQAKDTPIRLPGGSVALSREAWEAHDNMVRAEPTADALVMEILRIQQERDPDGDPGDITIEIQDDGQMVTLSQDDGFGEAMTFGGSIIDVLRKLLEEVRGS